MSPIARRLFVSDLRAYRIRKAKDFIAEWWWVPVAVLLLWAAWRGL